jgi:hypothetical protein
MRPWMTNMQSVAHDAHEHIFASTGALAFANEHSGSAAPPASPMTLYCLTCARGRQSLVTLLTRCGLPLLVYFLADEKHSRCLTDKVYLPTIVCGRVLWHLGYTTEASAAAFTQSYGEFQRVASQQEPSYRGPGDPHRWL